MSFKKLQRQCEPEWQGILSHPFVNGMGRGTLTDGQLKYFITQDALYLRDFYRVLAMAGGRLEESRYARTMIRHAENVFIVEASLHETIAKAFGLRPEDIVKEPKGLITKAYTDHLVRTAYTESLPTLLAALLPCYWTYQAIGQDWAGRLPEHPLMRQWLETYNGEAYGQGVQDVVEIFEAISLGYPDDVAIAQKFHESMVYERLFWQQAWTAGSLLDH